VNRTACDTAFPSIVPSEALSSFYRASRRKEQDPTTKNLPPPTQKNISIKKFQHSAQNHHQLGIYLSKGCFAWALRDNTGHQKKGISVVAALSPKRRVAIACGAIAEVKNRTAPPQQKKLNKIELITK
jgi:hypothetical protein